MHPDRRVALFNLALRLFIFAFVGVTGSYLGSQAGFSMWQGLTVAWGACGVFLCFEQYRTATETIST